MKLSDWLCTWLKKYVRHTVKPQTYARYADACRLHILPRLGDLELAELSAPVLQEFVLHEIEEGNLADHTPLAPNTVLGITSVLKKALRDALALGYVKEIHISAMRLPRQEERSVTAFTVAEQERLVRFCLSHPNHNAVGIVLCLYTGIRLGELLALTWQDVDFAEAQITVRHTAYSAQIDGTYTTLLDAPKTKAALRTIPLPTPLCKLLRRQKRAAPYVISTVSGGMVDARSYQRTFSRILQRCGIPHKGFHSLRHTFATRALECGMDLKTLSDLLGHKNTTVTLDRYAHSLMLHKAAMMSRVGRSLCV